MILENHSMNKTLNYFAQNAKMYSAYTLAVGFSDIQERFLTHLSPDAAILNFGCGSERDTKAFLELGYWVTPVDGTRNFVALLSLTQELRYKSDAVLEIG